MKNITFILFILFLTNVKGQNNLGFENWDPVAILIPTPKDQTTAACHPYILHNSEKVQNAAVVPDNTILKDWSIISHGILRTTDAHSGTYAAVISMWYFGGKSILAYGSSSQVFTKIPKVQLNDKLFGVSGYYKYLRDSFTANDTMNKTAMLHVATYKANAAGTISEITRDSLLFGTSDTYQPFYLPVAYPNSNIVPDSVSIWFEIKGYGATTCERSNFLYLDDLEFHFTPLSLKDETLKLKLKVYPNPSSGILNMEYDNDIRIQEVQLTDTSGKTVRLFKAPSKILNIHNIASGIYFLNVTTNLGIVKEKIIIK